jgi:hypothetical protein
MRARREHGTAGHIRPILRTVFSLILYVTFYSYVVSSLAQRKRVGLITQRSEDRNLDELIFSSHMLCGPPASKAGIRPNVPTIAQRLRWHCGKRKAVTQKSKQCRGEECGSKLEQSSGIKHYSYKAPDVCLLGYSNE